MDFRYIFAIGASWDKDELVRFLGQKVKGQGHRMTKYCRRLYVSASSARIVGGLGG